MGMTKTAFRMWEEGRWDEYVDLKAELRSQGLVGGAFKSAVDRAYPVMSLEELEARRGEGLAPTGEEVSERRFREDRADQEKGRDARAAGEGETGKKGGGAELEVFPAEVFRRGGQVGQLEEIDWVKDNLAVRGVRPEDAPTSGAYAMWQVYSRTRSTRQFFFEKLWPRVLPSIRDLKQAKRFSDDGRKLDDLTDGVEKMAEAAKMSAQGRWLEHGVEVSG